MKISLLPRERRGPRVARPGPRGCGERGGAPGPASPGRAVPRGPDRAQPAGARERLDEVPGVFVLPILLEPVVERERPRERGDLFADHLLLLGEREVHGRILT